MGKSAPAEPVVLLVSDDVFVIPRLEDAARAAGMTPVVVDSAESLDAAGEPAPRAVPVTEPLEGSDGRFLRAVVEWHPALIVFDLSSAQLPWQRWIRNLTTSAATRRIPLVAFGPHVEENALKTARDLGAGQVLPRGAFLASLPGVLSQWADHPDPAAIESGCRQPASAEAQLGIAALQDGRYFESHEHLERAILDDAGTDGTVYRPLLHLAVACLHTERGNWRGAQKMLLRMRPWLTSLPDRCRGVDVAALRGALESLQSQLDQWQAGGEAPPVPFPPPQVHVDRNDR